MLGCLLIDKEAIIKIADILKSGDFYKSTHQIIFSIMLELFEQQEIEFLPVDPEDAVDQLVVSKWILRMLGDEYGVNISFAPKITVGKAGSGLHIHMLLQIKVTPDNYRLLPYKCF